MSNGEEVLSSEQSLLRCREVDVERDDLLRRLAVFKERQAVALRDTQVVLREMTQLGTSPQTIQADLMAAREKLSKDTREYETRVAQAKQQLDTAEHSLSQLDAWVSNQLDSNKKK